MRLLSVVFTSLFILFFSSCNSFQSYDLQEKNKTIASYSSAGSFYLATDSVQKALDTVRFIYQSKQNKNIWDKHMYYTQAAAITGRRLGDFKTAILYLDSVLNYLKEDELSKIDVLEYANIFIEKGFAYFELTDYKNSIDNYFKAENILNQNIDKCKLIRLVSAIAHVLYKQKEYNQSLIYFKRELEYYKRCKFDQKNFDPDTEQQVSDNIGLCFFKIKQYDSAALYYKKALQIIDNSKYLFRSDKKFSESVYYTCKGVVLGNLAKILAIKNKPDSSIKLYQQAIYYNTHLGFEKSDAQLCMVQLAELYLNMDSIQKMQIVLNDLYTSLQQTHNPNAEIDWYRLMSLYSNKTNSLLNELIFYKKYIEKRDSINNVKNNSQLLNITKELESKQQQLQINLLQKDNQLSKLYTSLTAAVLVLVAILAFFIFRSYKKEKHNLKLLTLLNNEILQQQQVLQNTMEQLKNLNFEKDRILNVVAHDLRNPIGAIANFLEIVQLKFKHTESEEKILNNSQQAALRSLHLINDLLEVNKMQSGELLLSKQNTDVVELITKSIDQLKYKIIAKQQQIIFNPNYKGVVISIDEEKIQRVIENLLDNAIKFSYINATIEVFLIEFPSVIQIQIKDNGIGIPVNLQEHLFTQSIVSKRKGTINEPSNGLGLSICKQIIELHGGKIWAKSDEKEETIFYIELLIT